MFYSTKGFRATKKGQYKEEQMQGNVQIIGNTYLREAQSNICEEICHNLYTIIL